jgi:formylglycine-generating enzyme required for sulfatase activity
VWSSLDLARRVAWLLIGAAAVAALVVLALHQARPPQRCPVGLASRGSRCCGVGQSAEASACSGTPERCAAGQHPTLRGCVASNARVALPAGRLVVAPIDWEAAQAGLQPHEADIAAFAIDSHEVSERAWQRCVDDGGCAEVALRGEEGLPVTGVSAIEAQAFCRHHGGTLPSNDQWTWAASGAEARRYPWGHTGAVCRRVSFGLADGPCAHGATSPELCGARPSGASPEGVHDLAGNVAEWTAPKNGQSAVRGGSFRDQTATDFRTWNQSVLSESARADDVGFRCVYLISDGPDAKAIP